MDINPYSDDCVKIDRFIDRKILELYKALTRGRPDDADKDAAMTWWNRGQIMAYEEIKRLVTIPPSKE